MSFFRRPALVLCRTYAVAEIISSHELEIFTLATLSSLKVCCVDFLLSRLCYVFAMFSFDPCLYFLKPCNCCFSTTCLGPYGDIICICVFCSILLCEYIGQKLNVKRSIKTGQVQVAKSDTITT